MKNLFYTCLTIAFLLIVASECYSQNQFNPRTETYTFGDQKGGLHLFEHKFTHDPVLHDYFIKFNRARKWQRGLNVTAMVVGVAGGIGARFLFSDALNYNGFALLDRILGAALVAASASAIASVFVIIANIPVARKKKKYELKLRDALGVEIISQLSIPKYEWELSMNSGALAFFYRF